MMHISGLKSFVLLTLLSLLVLPCFSAKDYYASLQFWCFSSQNVQFSYVSFDLRVDEYDAQMSVVTEFNLYGTEQFLKLWVDCYPMSSETQWAKALVRVEGSFLDLNGSRTYYRTYNNTIQVEPNRVQGINRTEYFLNFTDEILGIQRQIYPSQSPENCGIYGSLVLENRIHDTIGQVGTKRYLRLSLHVSSNSPYPWLLFPIVKIPEAASWVSARINAEDMTEIFPDQREATLTIMPSIENNPQIYAVWELPNPMSWQEILTKFPYSFILGIASGIVARYLYDWLSRWGRRKKDEKSSERSKVMNGKLEPVRETETIYHCILERFSLEIDRKKELDNKATQLIGFVGIISSMVTILGGTYLNIPNIREWNLDSMILLSPIIVFVLALILFFSSFAFVLKALQIKEFTYVPDAFKLIGAYASSDKETILRDLSDDYAIAISDNRKVNDRKADDIKKAVWSLFLAFPILLFHMILSLIL